MMNNILYMILSQVILVAWLKFNFNSSLYEIYPKLYDTVDILKIKERYNNFSIDLILFNGILSFVLFRNNVNVSLSIPIILSLAQFLESSFTDVIIKEVNRHSLRFVYIVLYFYSMFYLTSQGRVLDTRRATCQDLKKAEEVYLQVFKINFLKIELKGLLACITENKVVFL